MNFQSVGVPSPEWALAHDDELVQRVVTRLQERLGCQVREFQMSSREDGLILRGQVGSYYGKQLAQEVVMEVSGLPILTNDIEVQCLAVTPRGRATAK